MREVSETKRKRGKTLPREAGCGVCVRVRASANTRLHCFVGEKRQNSVMTQGEEEETFSFQVTEPNGKQSYQRLDPPVEKLTSCSLTGHITSLSVSQSALCLSLQLSLSRSTYLSLCLSHFICLSLCLSLYFSMHVSLVLCPSLPLCLKRFICNKVTD